MKDPCLWCDGKMCWDGAEWVQSEICLDEDFCDYRRLYLEQEQEKFIEHFRREEVARRSGPSRQKRGELKAE